MNAETDRLVPPIQCGGCWPDDGESTAVFSWRFIGKGASKNGWFINVAFSDSYKPLTLWRVHPLTYGHNPFKIGVRKASGIPTKHQIGTHNFCIEYEVRAKGFHPVGEHNKVALQGHISVALQVKKAKGGCKMVIDQINAHDGNGWIDSNKVTIKLQDFGSFDASFEDEKIYLTPGSWKMTHIDITGDYCKPIEIKPTSFTSDSKTLSLYTYQSEVENASVDPLWFARATNNATEGEWAYFRVWLYGTKPTPDLYTEGVYYHRYISTMTSVVVRESQNRG